MREKFHPKKGQMMIALFDDDKAGKDAICEILKLDAFSGKARKKGDIWYALIPAY